MLCWILKTARYVTWILSEDKREYGADVFEEYMKEQRAVKADTKDRVIENTIRAEIR